MNGPTKEFFDLLKTEVSNLETGIEARFHSVTKQRLELLLMQKAQLEIEAAAGADVDLRRTAFEASLMNLALQERVILADKAKDLAIRALFAAIRTGIAVL